jgi:hypothetical protein
VSLPPSTATVDAWPNGPCENGTASAATLVPAASLASRSDASARNRAVVATTALDRYGTGATARPISSSTTAASRRLAPAPPRCSGKAIAASAISPASARQTDGSYAPVSTFASVCATGVRAASSDRTDERRSSSTTL